MTAKEYLEKTEVWEKVSDTNLAKKTLIDFAEDYAKLYHRSEVKNLGLFDVMQQRELVIGVLRQYNQVKYEYTKLTYEDYLNKYHPNL